MEGSASQSGRRRPAVVPRTRRSSRAQVMTVTGESTLAGESRAGGQGVHPIARLVHVAVQTEDPGRLLDAAADELGRPLGLVGDAGEPLGHAPAGAAGRKALTVARSAATTHLLPGRR